MISYRGGGGVCVGRRVFACSSRPIRTFINAPPFAHTHTHTHTHTHPPFSYYAAPEILDPQARTNGYDPLKSDMWSTGIILYGLLTGRSPFRVALPEDKSFAKLLRYGTYPWPTTLSQPARDLLWSILRVDPNGRPSIDDILNSEWCQLGRGGGLGGVVTF
jgi:serine/threonine protein kinase